jgi:hypothetical protein
MCGTSVHMASEHPLPSDVKKVVLHSIFCRAVLRPSVTKGFLGCRHALHLSEPVARTARFSRRKYLCYFSILRSDRPERKVGENFAPQVPQE